MNKSHIEFIGRLGEAPLGEVKEVFDNYLRGCVRDMITSAMSEEVATLCGKNYHPDRACDYQRAGNAPGIFWDNTQRSNIKRPRVRKKKSDGTTEEVHLATYEAASDSSMIQEAIIESLICGVSGRKQERIFPKAKGASKSNVSRIWVKHGSKIFQAFRSRDISSHKWVALFADGIHLTDGLVAVVALGVTTTGEKVVLDFELGSSENFEVCKDLLERVKKRGFFPQTETLLAITDGGAGLRKAIRFSFEKVIIQRCLVHKERNIRGRLNRKYHGELAAHFKVLRNAQTLEDAELAIADLRVFLGKHSKVSLESLEEAGEELLAFQRLELPSTLNISFLSTNNIENCFRNTRSTIGKVARWRKETDQPQRWLACAFTEAEKGFKRIKGYRDLPLLVEALNHYQMHFALT